MAVMTPNDFEPWMALLKDITCPPSNPLFATKKVEAPVVSHTLATNLIDEVGDGHPRGQPFAQDSSSHQNTNPITPDDIRRIERGPKVRVIPGKVPDVRVQIIYRDGAFRMAPITEKGK
jgi:hypothetical protein